MICMGQSIISVQDTRCMWKGGGEWGGGGDRGTWEYLLALKDGARAAVTCS